MPFTRAPSAKTESKAEAESAKPKASARGKVGAKSAAGDSGPPRFGLQLRHYRRMHKLKLKELAALAGCSESLLSRIENDQLNPSLATLHRLCKALDISMANMMTPEKPGHCIVTRPGERLVVGRTSRRGSEKTEAEIFIPYADGRLLEGMVFTLLPGGTSNGQLLHQGEEVGYVLDGDFELTVQGETHCLGPGCTFYFRSELPHEFRNPGPTTTRLLWINTPPTY